MTLMMKLSTAITLGILIFFQQAAFADGLRFEVLTQENGYVLGLVIKPELSSEAFVHVPDFGLALAAQTDPSPLTIVAGGVIVGAEGREFQSFSWCLPVGASPNNFCFFKVSVKGEDGHPVHTLFAPIAIIDSQPLAQHPDLVQYTVTPATFGFEHSQLLTIESPILIGIESNTGVPVTTKIRNSKYDRKNLIINLRPDIVLPVD